MKSIIFSIFLLVFCKAQKSAWEVRVVDDISRFETSNPEVKVVQLNAEHKQREGEIIYWLGSRRPGDRLVAAATGNPVRNKPRQNVELVIWYPADRQIGAQITQIMIRVKQSTGSIGRAIVVYGGLTQRNVQLIIEAGNITDMQFKYEIYGNYH